MTLKRKHPEDAFEDMSRKLSSVGSSLNHKIERTREEVLDLENRLLIVEKMCCRKEHIVPLVNRIVKVETFLNDLGPCVSLQKEALKSCVTQEECATYVKALEQKMRETLESVRGAVDEPWEKMNTKANAAIARIDHQLSGLFQELKQLSTSASPRTRQVDRKLLQDYPVDNSAQYYMEALRAINIPCRKTTFLLLQEWIAEGNAVHIRRTKWRGKECYGIVGVAIPLLKDYVMRKINQ